MQHKKIDNSKHITRNKSKLIGPVDDNKIIDTTIILNDKNNVNQVIEYITKNGLTVKEIIDDHIIVTGDHSSYKKAFKVKLDNYQLDNNLYHAHDDDIHIPDHLKDVIIGIIGFDTSPIAWSYAKKPHITEQKGTYTPIQLANIYNFPSNLTGTGQSVAIIELGGGYNISDMKEYFKMLGIDKAPKIVSIGVDGASNNPGVDTGSDTEVVLDIQVIAAIVPDATIVVYFAPNTDKGFYDAIFKAINDTTYKPSVISISWGGPEVYWSKSSLNNFNNLLNTASSKNITVCAASGDNGASDGINDGYNHVDFPASSPYVLSCGGTKLTYNNNVIKEIVWNENNGASGGGISNIFTSPTYQKNLHISKRGVPDVCGDADPQTGYNIYINGQTEVIGGTSAVAPLWTALIAQINQSINKNVGFINPILYNNSLVCRDVKKGDNDGYSAKKGWDACTGLGSPDGQKILNLFSQANYGGVNSSDSLSTSPDYEGVPVNLSLLNLFPFGGYLNFSSNSNVNTRSTLTTNIISSTTSNKSTTTPLINSSIQSTITPSINSSITSIITPPLYSSINHYTSPYNNNGFLYSSINNMNYNCQNNCLKISVCTNKKKKCKRNC